MSAAGAYFARMLEKHLWNTSVEMPHLRDESPDRTDWTIDLTRDDGVRMTLYIVELEQSDSGVPPDGIRIYHETDKERAARVENAATRLALPITEAQRRMIQG